MIRTYTLTGKRITILLNQTDIFLLDFILDKETVNKNNKKVGFVFNNKKDCIEIFNTNKKINHCLTSKVYKKNTNSNFYLYLPMKLSIKFYNDSKVINIIYNKKKDIFEIYKIDNIKEFKTIDNTTDIVKKTPKNIDWISDDTDEKNPFEE